MGEHTHKHEHSAEPLDLEKLQILLNHMKEHNEHHTEEVGKMANNAAELGKKEAAELLKKAAAIYDEANALLTEAIKLL